MKDGGDTNSISPGELARRIFTEHYANCFWHLRPDLVVTESMIPWMIEELCTHGGRKGMLAAAELQNCKLT